MVVVVVEERSRRRRWVPRKSMEFPDPMLAGVSFVRRLERYKVGV